MVYFVFKLGCKYLLYNCGSCFSSALGLDFSHLHLLQRRTNDRLQNWAVEIAATGRDLSNLFLPF